MENRKILRNLESVENMNKAVKNVMAHYEKEKVALAIRNLYVSITRFTEEFDYRFSAVDNRSDQWVQYVIDVTNKMCNTIAGYLGNNMSESEASDICVIAGELVDTVSKNYDFCSSAEKLRDSARDLQKLLSNPRKASESVNAGVMINPNTASLDDLLQIISDIVIRQVKFTPDSEDYADFEAKIRDATDKELEIDKLLYLLDLIRSSTKDYIRSSYEKLSTIESKLEVNRYYSTMIFTIIQLRDSICNGIVDDSDITAIQEVWELLIKYLKVDGCKENLVLIDEWHNLANELDMSSIKDASAGTKSLLYRIRWDISEIEEAIGHDYENNPLITISEALRHQVKLKYKDIFKGQMVNVINLSTHRDAEDCLAIASRHFGIWWAVHQPVSIESVSTYKSVDLDLLNDYIDISENKTLVFVDLLEAVLTTKQTKLSKGSLIVDMTGRIVTVDDYNLEDKLNGDPGIVNITGVIFGKPIEQIYCRVFSKFLGITEDQCIEVLDKSGYKIDANDNNNSFRQSKNENYTIQDNPKGVLDFLTTADELHYVKQENITDIKMRVKYSNKEKPEDYDLKFIQGNKLSDLGCNVVHAINEKFIIGSDWEGAMSFGSVPYTIMRLTGPLVLDEDKKFSYCRPLSFNFKDIEWKHTIHLSDGDVLKVEGNVVINADCPIDATGSITIEGVGEGARLILCNYDAMQPCIGSQTNTGLSYGRWEVSSGKCVSITLDNIIVECDSTNESFTLGEYGTDNIPSIYLTSSAEIIAPEINHDRVMTVGPDYVPGSTKLSTGVEYKLFKLNTQEVGHCEAVITGSIDSRVADMQEEMRKVLEQLD